LLKKNTGNGHEIPEGYFIELIDILGRENIGSKSEVHALKLRLCKKFRLSRIPSDPEVLIHVPPDKRERFEKILRLKPMRTASGVSPVAVMTSPADCPHGVCIYCPGGMKNHSPQSYTGQEPAALRAGEHGFDPFLQTENRLQQYTEIGHPTDKIDLIIMGGTFTSRSIEYQDLFINGCFNALNERISGGLKTAHLLNESATHRCVGLTIETRPDRCMAPEIDQILRLGGTRVELGVQTTFDHILESVNRGHTTIETRKSTKLIKDAGLKLLFHMMPGLPGTTTEMDLSSFKELFENSEYRPDMLKIYPTLVVRGTELYEIWRRGEYHPLETEDAVSLLKDVKKLIPRYVRIQRIQRDIPARLIEAGVRKSNLRQLVQQALEAEGDRCRCIRCREVGHNDRKVDSIELYDMEYDSSGGKEVFLSLEDRKNEVLIGFLRLRFPSQDSENGKLNRAIVRELRIMGQEVPIGEREEDRYQHTGYGRKLLERAEEIARQAGVGNMIVTSGVGVRPYYRKFGYERSGFYMEKELN